MGGAVSAIAGPVLGLAGGLISGGKAADAAKGQAEALRAAADKASAMAQFNPYGMTTNFGTSTFNNGQGILVSTNRRLIFIDKGLIYGLKVEDFPIDKITSIQYETGLLVGKVKIHTSGNIASIENVEKLSSRSFAEFIREKICFLMH